MALGHLGSKQTQMGDGLVSVLITFVSLGKPCENHRKPEENHREEGGSIFGQSTQGIQDKGFKMRDSEVARQRVT